MSYGNIPSVGAGRSTSIIDRSIVVPAFMSPAARRQRLWTTTVCFSLSATRLLPSPRAYSSSRVRSTISRQVKGDMEKG